MSKFGGKGNLQGKNEQLLRGNLSCKCTHLGEKLQHGGEKMLQFEGNSGVIWCSQNEKFSMKLK